MGWGQGVFGGEVVRRLLEEGLPEGYYTRSLATGSGVYNETPKGRTVWFIS